MFDITTQTRQQPPQLVTLPSPSQPAALKVPPAQDFTIDYLSMVFETLLDTVFPFQGFLLIDQQGNLMQSSPYGRQLVEQIDRHGEPDRSQPLSPTSEASLRSLPPLVERLVDYLIESRQLFPGALIQLEDEVALTDATRVSLAARWVDLAAQSTNCIVVTLENRTAIAQQQAEINARRFQLTKRETEVLQYSLLGLSYLEIAKALFITINTVKQHMKRIYRKQEQ